MKIRRFALMEETLRTVIVNEDGTIVACNDTGGKRTASWCHFYLGGIKTDTRRIYVPMNSTTDMLNDIMRDYIMKYIAEYDEFGLALKEWIASDMRDALFCYEPLDHLYVLSSAEGHLAEVMKRYQRRAGRYWEYAQDYHEWCRRKDIIMNNSTNYAMFYGQPRSNALLAIDISYARMARYILTTQHWYVVYHDDLFKFCRVQIDRLPSHQYYLRNNMPEYLIRGELGSRHPKIARTEALDRIWQMYESGGENTELANQLLRSGAWKE